MKETIRLLLGGDPLLQTALLFIGGVAGVVTFVLTLMRLFGGVDTDHDAHGFAHDHGISVESFLSVQSLSMFFTMFGLVGFACLRTGYSTVPALGIGVAVGVSAMAIMLMLMRSISSLGQSGTMLLTDVATASGTAQTRIPGRGEIGIGIVLLQIGGTSHEYQATAGCDSSLPAGSFVKVTEVRGSNAVIVVPV